MLDLLSYGATGWGDELLQGAGMTLLVAVLAYLIGLGAGCLTAAAKLSGPLPLRWLAATYTTVVRGVPALLVIWLLFYGGSGLVGWMAGLFGYGGRVELSAFAVGVASVGLVSGAYAAEVIRGAVQAVPKGQLEAARALGMHRLLILRRILAPQALRYALPGLGNVWQMTLKDTTLVSVVSLAELMRQAYVASGSTRQPFLFYLVAALVYLVITTLSETGFRALSRRADRGVRRATA
ncbi:MULTISPECIES: ABC transporter permease [unclassified Azospirillum]|uniref:ABC transporter permease n=1 Tax=unclassified Azospirillum TaxID=2630922 RepID=UPI000B767E77|nr:MULTISPECIES: ABC transporter permease [unclassified Azospirillum]SNS31982.1 octopine/nopaline transport system permease protein [Azospirillum sp. RU38E]SNS50381.1 octopine/nopaline transport system permease protein [Azospirillum sp. RU37A]